jgi:hypothetical protein
MIVTGGVLEISQAIIAFHWSHKVLLYLLYYTADLAGFMSEHQFVAFINILKRTVQNCNKHIDAIRQNDDVLNDPPYANETNRQESALFTVSNNSVTSNRVKFYSKVMRFKQLRELHDSACDIAESVNAIYSPMLLLSVAKSFTSLTFILYYILMSFIVQKTSSFCEFTTNGSYFVWLIIYSARLISLVYFTAASANEVSHKVQYF